MRRYASGFLMLVVVLTGCEALKNPVAIDWIHGAKRGTVTRAFDATTPREQLPTCLSSYAASQLATHRFVEVEYLHRRHVIREVADLPADVTAKLGTAVELYPKDCDAGQLSRVSRALPSPS